MVFMSGRESKERLNVHCHLDTGINLELNTILMGNGRFSGRLRSDGFHSRPLVDRPAHRHSVQQRTTFHV